MTDLPPLPPALDLPQPRSRLLTSAENPTYLEDLRMLVLAGLVPDSGRTEGPRRQQQLMIKQWAESGKLSRADLREMWLICEGGREEAA